jgi:hypothetical protein
VADATEAMKTGRMLSNSGYNGLAAEVDDEGKGKKKINKNKKKNK